MKKVLFIIQLLIFVAVVSSCHKRIACPVYSTTSYTHSTAMQRTMKILVADSLQNQISVDRGTFRLIESLDNNKVNKRKSLRDGSDKRVARK